LRITTNSVLEYRPGAQKVLGLVMELAEVGPDRQVSHDVSLITRWSASGPERERHL
jgi:hypothetical protein